MVDKLGRDAKEVALYFHNKIGGKATPAMYARTIKQAKSILNAGYTEQEMISCIDYIIDIKKIDMYSIGYLSYAIEPTLKELEKVVDKKIVDEIKYKMDNMNREVSTTNDSTERNKQKAQNIGTKSRFGEKFAVDLSSTTRQNN